jgi:hypothetical protein
MASPAVYDKEITLFAAIKGGVDSVHEIFELFCML